MTAPPPRHYLIRLRRDGPLVPARLRWLDHEPGEPDNKLDRGSLVPFPAVDIAGKDVEPEVLIERVILQPNRRGDMLKQPAALLADFLAAPSGAVPLTHWRYAQPISEAEYRHQLKLRGWAQTYRPSHPVLQPRQRVDPAQLPIPDFTREHEA
jgi:hypothetical protein